MVVDAAVKVVGKNSGAELLQKTTAKNSGSFLPDGPILFYCSFVHGFNRSLGNSLLNDDEYGNPGLFYQYTHVKVNVYPTTDKGVFF